MSLMVSVVFSFWGYLVRDSATSKARKFLRLKHIARRCSSVRGGAKSYSRIRNPMLYPAELHPRDPLAYFKWRVFIKRSWPRGGFLI